ncbi:MAG: hypothetical protein EOL87_05615 [Spartobacteria bacterium]|nr:hypothetical protein [Spartobacteria bacterium]
MKLMKHLNAVLMPLMAIALFAGCAGYKLGNTLPSDIRNIYVPSFVNQTTEPNIDTVATDATIARFQFDGSANMTDKKNADATLLVTLTGYTTEAISFENDNDAATKEYRGTLSAQVVLIRNSDQSVIMENPRITGDATFYVYGDLANAKRTAQPDITEDLALHIVDAITQTW